MAWRHLRQRLKHFRWLLFIYLFKKQANHKNNSFPCTYKFPLHLIIRRVNLGTFEEKLSDAVLCFSPPFVWCIPPRWCLRWEQSLRALPWSVAVSTQPQWHVVGQMNLAEDLKTESLTLPNKTAFFWSIIIEFQLKLSFVVNNIAMLGQKKRELHICIPLVVKYYLFFEP